MDRKKFLQLSGAALAASAVSPAFGAAGPDEENKKIRIAHLTDVHIHPDGPSAEGFARALHKAQSLNPAPDLIFNGGDAIMDSLKTGKSATRAQWNLFTSVLKSENSLPVHHCIGNHDVWGWALKEDKSVTGDELYGKQWAMEALGMENRYYSFERAGWHFIVLDSVHPSPFRYEARLDKQQFDWLKTDLGNVPSHKPVAILSHIPILSFCSRFFSGENRNKPSTLEWSRRSLMHTDSWEIKDLFLKYKNIKICMAGHLHMQEELHYLDIKYLVNGAVSGNWWKGAFYEFKPAFALIDLYDDGTTAHQWITY